ncbi:MAG: L-histidine N(alpha)-methyltransferase [Chitinophagales bacterium]
MGNSNSQESIQIVSIDRQFAEDVRSGLSSSPKTLPPKYFYDEKGDAIFQQIMELEEYYPTRCEYSIFDTYKKDWLQLFQNTGKPFRLIEFGAGDGYKTKILLDAFTQTKANFQFVPIDISANILKMLEGDLTESYPNLDVQPFNGDYFEALESLETDTIYRKVVLFLGGNIGNFIESEAISFLSEIQQRLSKDDLLLMGVDLKKNPKTILDAYHDKEGVTEAFNHNLLTRINKELGGNFKLENFIHFPTYNPLTGDTKSYLVANKTHEVHIEALDQTFFFEAWEAIDTEISKKYALSGVERLAQKAGFEVVKHYFDSQKYFVDTVWRKK